MLNFIELKKKKNILDESLLSVIKRTRKEKRSALGSRTAIQIAKDRNPSLYKKYKKFRDLYLSVKHDIEKKYGSRGLMFARQRIK